MILVVAFWRTHIKLELVSTPNRVGHYREKGKVFKIDLESETQSDHMRKNRLARTRQVVFDKIRAKI